MKNDDLIWALQNEIVHIYQTEGLTCLRGLDSSYIVNGRQIIQWYSEVVRPRRLVNSEFDFNKNFDDLLICSDEVMYSLANLYLYLPHINDPVEDRFGAWDKTIYPNEQNLGAKRFNMYAGIVSEKLYNYWDRIGDLIAAYFPELINPKQVYFYKALSIVPEDYRESENYQWLDTFRKTGYAQFNKKRKQTVHHITLDTEFKYEHSGKVMDEKKMIKLMEKRRGLPDFFKRQLKETLVGFEKSLLLIKEISDRSPVNNETPEWETN